MRKTIKNTFLVLTLLLSTVQVYASIGLDLSQWTLDGGVEVVAMNDEDALKFSRGKLINHDLDFQDGTIEFDMYSGGERAFVYVYFRQESDDTGEVLYLRTHKSNAPDTLQYSPVIQKRSAWQLYHGEKGTASATLPVNTWTHVKMQVIGNRMWVWVGDKDEPAMSGIPLTGVASRGGITFRGNIPPVSGAEYSAYIKNIKIVSASEEQTSMTNAVAATDSTDNSIQPITQVLISPVFADDKSPKQALPEAMRWDDWRVAHAEQDGLFELLRWQTIPKGVRSWAATLQFNLDAAQAQTCELRLGYSDAISLLLNDQPIAYADASYRYGKNRQEGVLHDDQMRLFLPLKQGENRVHAVVADSFGGWGFKAALAKCNGVSVNLPAVKA